MTTLSAFTRLLVVGFLMVWVSCSQPGVKRYQGILDDKVDSAKKEDVDKLLGEPSFCVEETGLKKCEYRTAKIRNYPTPAIFKKPLAMGPDVSPYEFFDVLHLFYDEERVLKEWQPIVVEP